MSVAAGSPSGPPNPGRVGGSRLLSSLTTTREAMAELLRGRRRLGEPAATDPPADFYSPRELIYATPVGRRLSDYEASICMNQPDFGQYDSGGWYLLSPEGRGLFDEGSTALRHPDWFDYRDPSALWQRTYVRRQAEQERAIAAALETARTDDAFADIDSAWACDILARYYEAWGCAEWGLFFAYTYPVREALSDTLTMAFVFASVDHLRHQQAIGLYSLDLEDEVLGYRSGLGRETWLNDPALQPTRRVVEELMATGDWGEMAVVTALLVEPLLSAFVTSQFLRRHAAVNGDIFTPTIILTAERDRARNRAAAVALVELVLGATDRRGRPVPAGHNHEVLQGWIDRWTPLVIEAVDTFAPVFDLLPRRGPSAGAARERVLADYRDLLSNAGLEVPEATS